MSDGAVGCLRDGAVLRLILNRPERRNSLSHSMTDSLVTALTAAAYDDSLRAVCIEGTGADFAVVPSGAYPALEDGLAELGFSRVHDDGTFEVYARKAAP